MKSDLGSPLVALLLLACAGWMQDVRAAADPTDLRQSSFATPARGDVIAWTPALAPRRVLVNFDSGSAVPSAEARTLLESLARRLVARQDLQVLGRPDPGGPLALGLARARAIRRALVQSGIQAERIKIVADGATSSSGSADQGADDPAVSEIRWVEPAVANPVAPARSALEPPAAVVVAAASRPEVAPADRPPSEPEETSASSASKSPGSPQVEASVWEVRVQDITLERVLRRWCLAAGYRLQWDAERNFLIAAPDAYKGSFEAALRTVLGSAGIQQSDYPLEACVYANRPPLVRVTRQGGQARECTLD